MQEWLHHDSTESLVMLPVPISSQEKCLSFTCSTITWAVWGLYLATLSVVSWTLLIYMIYNNVCLLTISWITLRSVCSYCLTTDSCLLGWASMLQWSPLWRWPLGWYFSSCINFTRSPIISYLFFFLLKIMWSLSEAFIPCFPAEKRQIFFWSFFSEIGVEWKHSSQWWCIV